MEQKKSGYRKDPLLSWLWARGITAVQFAQASGVSTTYIRALAKQRRPLTYHAKAKLVAGLRKFSHVSERDRKAFQNLLELYFREGNPMTEERGE